MHRAMRPGCSHPGDGECGCSNVVELAGCVDDLTAGCARYADDHGHSGAGVVHVRAFDGEAVVAEHVAVVAGKDDDGVVRKICIVECLQDAPDLFVDEGDGGMVADAAFAQGVIEGKIARCALACVQLDDGQRIHLRQRVRAGPSMSR